MEIRNQYFLDQMQQLLGEEDYQRFVASFSLPMAKSLRINTLKADYDLVNSEIALGEQTPFDKDTYYIAEEDKPGKHPFHLAGLYYLQEPSTTMVVNALDVREGDIVLDLCAAPGGKSTQILSRLNNKGFLFANEYDRQRANTLLSNLERYGAANYLLSNSTVDNLCPQLQGICDRVLIDAPCSGASMFKKYPESVSDYTPANVAACASRQLHILSQAARTLKEGGIMVYSTCTYNREENEDVIAAFLAEHPEFELMDSGLTCGQPGFDPQHLTRRVFPYQQGEGHFVAKMIRTGANNPVRIRQLSYSHNPLVDRFLQDHGLKYDYTVIADRVYLSPQPLYDLKVSILRQGILLGQIVKNRLEPHHHFYSWCRDIKNICELTDAKMLNDFLRGNSLMIPGYRSYVQIRYRGVPIGFGKADGQQIKNHLPKGLRTL